MVRYHVKNEVMRLPQDVKSDGLAAASTERVATIIVNVDDFAIEGDDVSHEMSAYSSISVAAVEEASVGVVELSSLISSLSASVSA